MNEQQQVRAIKLSEGHKSVVRVALNLLIEDMSVNDALGKDTHEKLMREGYKARANEVLALINQSNAELLVRKR